FVFFFQAEDGIRDRNVTGVQTCALPISFYRFDSMEQFRVWREMDERDEEPVVIYHSHTATEAYPSRTDISYASEPGAHYVLVSRSEERRVGKECRSRWSR